MKNEFDLEQIVPNAIPISAKSGEVTGISSTDPTLDDDPQSWGRVTTYIAIANLARALTLLHPIAQIQKN